MQAEQSPDLVLSRLADLFVDRGQMQEARSIRDALKNYPRSVVALGAIANIDFALRDGAGLKDSLETLIPLLSRRSARNLPADRRISIAALLYRTKHADLARDQMTACLEELDAATLRTLTPSAAVNLMVLSGSLEIPFPDEALKSLAVELIPPEVRERILPK